MENQIYKKLRKNRKLIRLSILALLLLHLADRVFTICSFDTLAGAPVDEVVYTFVNPMCTDIVNYTVWGDSVSLHFVTIIHNDTISVSSSMHKKKYEKFRKHVDKRLYFRKITLKYQEGTDWLYISHRKGNYIYEKVMGTSYFYMRLLFDSYRLAVILAAFLFYGALYIIFLKCKQMFFQNFLEDEMDSVFGDDGESTFAEDLIDDFL